MAGVYRITEQPLGAVREVRLITIGAGISGLNMVRHVDLHMENVQHVVYEKNEDVGGTWLENK
jgi:cation diffusion facilitator CzcD-associated flavoprotein CzcO